MDNFSRFNLIDFIGSIFTPTPTQAPQLGAPYPAIGHGAENVGSHIATSQNAARPREELVDEIEGMLTDFWCSTGGDPYNIANNLQPIVEVALTGLGYVEFSKVKPGDVKADVCKLLKDAAAKIDHYQVHMRGNPVKMIEFAVDETNAVGGCLQRLCAPAK